MLWAMPDHIYVLGNLYKLDEWFSCGLCSRWDKFKIFLLCISAVHLRHSISSLEISVKCMENKRPIIFKKTSSENLSLGYKWGRANTRRQNSAQTAAKRTKAKTKEGKMYETRIDKDWTYT